MSTEFAHPLDMPVLHGIAALAAAKQPIPPQNLDGIDACIAEYESAEQILAAAKANHDEAKAGLIALVQTHGATPTGADYSKRLLGRRNVATVTIGNTTVIHEQFVDELGVYCAEQKLDSVFDRLFVTDSKHKLIEGARTVLASLVLPRRTYDRILSMFGKCFDVKTNAPVLKVKLIEPEKPVRKPRAAKKANA